MFDMKFWESNLNRCSYLCLTIIVAVFPFWHFFDHSRDSFMHLITFLPFCMIALFLVSISFYKSVNFPVITLCDSFLVIRQRASNKNGFVISYSSIERVIFRLGQLIIQTANDRSIVQISNLSCSDKAKLKQMLLSKIEKFA
mgnify:CR=1 FL=1